MSTLALVQAFLASMLLGFYIFGVKIGSNPFILLRETPEFVNLPLFQFPDYLTKLDGRGLNPLLQNYWMTIHPPTLFLGFASTIVPFVYAIAGLWKKKYGEWQLDALPCFLWDNDIGHRHTYGWRMGLRIFEFWGVLGLGIRLKMLLLFHG